MTIERDNELLLGLTVWAPDVSAQVRDKGVVLALRGHVSSEDGNPTIIDLESAVALRDLLNVATARGAFDGVTRGVLA